MAISLPGYNLPNLSVPRYSFMAVALMLIAGLVWFLGPFIWFLEPWQARVVLVTIIALIVIGVNWFLARRRARKEKALTDGVTADNSGEEVAAIKEKLATALATLKTASGSRGYLYEQPWFVIIGPPGAGKTTALINSGLKFPLAEGALPGVGGTRLCDWWFTDQAVLIDTAGRYTTQDSSAVSDRAGWEAFLGLLRRTRPRQPLNGVIVAISVKDAIEPGAEKHALAIRVRVKELTEKLGVRLPVYAMLTKADLIAGFTEFFDNLDRDRRDQVWGSTFPWSPTPPQAGAVAEFRQAFAPLVARLDARLEERLQAERSPDRRVLIAGFPAQVSSLLEPLGHFLTTAFGGTRLEPAPLLRGVYFASGTQEGTPLDRLTGVLATSFGLSQRELPILRPTAGRSYFLGRLLRQVVFGEALLVSEPPGRRRRRMLLRAGAFACVGLLTVGGAALLWRRGHEGNARVAQLSAALTEYEKTAAALKLDPVTDGDLAIVAPLLDQARALPFGNEETTALGNTSRTVYRHALEWVLLPRLIYRLESGMRGALDRSDYLYEATKVYLMLGGQGPLDRDLVREWMTLDWANAYPGATRAGLRAALATHLDALLANPLPAVPLDGALVENARRSFSRVTMAERVYSRVRPSAAARKVAAFVPADVLGASGTRVFTRASGKPLTEGVPGFYTVDGFHRVLLPALSTAMKDVVTDSWVLGPDAQPQAADPALASLEKDVIAQYVADYAKTWDALLADIAVVPLRNLQQSVQDLYILSSPQSPMKDLLMAVARQLTLSEPPADMKAEKPATPPSNLQAVMAPTTPVAPPGQTIDERYKALRDYVGHGPGAPIDITLKLLNDLQQQLAPLANAAGGGSAPAVATGPDPGQLLRAEAYRLPVPVSGWLQTLAATGNQLRVGGAKQQAAAAFNGPSGPASLCRDAVEGRYPFRPDPNREIPLDDFARLFAPGGRLDAFFSQQLRAFVDQSAAGWKLQPVGGVSPPINEANLQQFQRAALIRDLFFGGGGATAAVKFEIAADSADATTKEATLDLSGLTIPYQQGPSRTTQVIWPGPQGMSDVSLTFNPPPSSGPASLREHGPWALFRLFGRGQLARGASPEEFLLTFTLADRKIVYKVRAGSVNNPFAAGVLQSFQCPKLL